MNRRPLLLALFAALALALTVALAPGDSADAADCPTGTGSGATFTYTGKVEQIGVPPGVDRVTVEIRGGHGGQYDTTGHGGPAGLVTATIKVNDEQCLSIYVARQGRHDGGWGWAKGGDEGNTHGVPPLGHGGAGGGGASAVTVGSGPLVIAGGGGGGGGTSLYSNYYGGAGGAGADAQGGNTPGGENGSSPRYAASLELGGEGGWGGDGPKGGDGTSTYWPVNGGGGGGGAGIKGGDGGYPYISLPNRNQHEPYGGGGGGGGSSYAIPQATGVHYDRATAPCRPDHDEPGCEGFVTLSWLQEPAHIEAAGGEDQGAIVTEPFSLPLRAKVTAKSGDPVPGATVTFTLPASGPSGTFPEEARTATATTGADGIATAPRITAGAGAGLWTATATVSGTSIAARFGLEDMPAHTATGLQLTPSAPSDGAPTELLAQVVSQPSTAGKATGEVLFRVDGKPLGLPVALDAAALAHLPGAELDAGKHTVSAEYSGDENHAPSHTSLPVDVAPAGSEVRLRSAQNPSAAGAAVTFSASVTAAPPTSRKPAGEVQLLVDGIEAASATLAADGSVSWPPVTLATEGEHQIEARYLGDEHFGATGATLIQAVGADASAVAVDPSAPYATYGEPLSWTVKVSSQVAGTPSGSVTVAAGGETICSSLPLLAAEAVCSPAEPLAPGTHEITAAYSGDAQHAPAHGAAEQVVRAAASTVAAEVVPEATVFGQLWRLHADVAAGGGSPIAAPPTGMVRFTVDGAPVGEAVPLGADGATLANLPSPGAGAHVVAAEYAGDARFLPGRAIAPAEVSPALAEATLSSSAPGVSAGSPVSFRATLAAVPAGPVPSGQVRFLVDGKQRGATVPLRDGVAETPAWIDLTVGQHRIEAEYLGDGDFRPALGTLTQRIAPAPARDSGAKGGAGGGPGAAAEPPRRGCGGVAITALRRHGRMLRLSGRAEPRLEGRRVAIRLGKRRVATTAVRANGRFRATFPLPRAQQPRKARYRAVVAGIRSAPVSLGGGAKPSRGCRPA